jgi:FtsP/CotA-like multicopper oxidase with cupredoxin domain
LSRSIALVLLVALNGTFAPARSDRVSPNDNRQRAGVFAGGVLTVGLEARVGNWHPNGDDAPGMDLPAFAEVGKAPQIPGPLIRAVAGTRVSATVRNRLPNDTLLVHGLYSRETGAKAAPPLRLLPGEQRVVEFVLGTPGTYYYWATTMGRLLRYRVHEDSQLTGVIVVDPPDGSGPPARGGASSEDRIFVIGMMADTVGGAMPHGRRQELAVIYGRSWPNTERLSYTVGDTVRWRVINASGDLHPMHLHGFYFRLDARGDEVADTTYAESDRELAVTELVQLGGTMRVTWVPERDGNWAFHCHIPEHIEPRGPLGLLPLRGHTHGGNHAMEGMGGLVLSVHVAPRAGQPSTAERAAAGRRRYRLVAEERPGSSDASALRFALGDGNGPLARDSVGRLGPAILVRVGEPASVTVVNQSSHTTTVHWHGIELESYFDGIAGLSGTPMRLAPVIAPKDSFEARFTPPRAGTFIYHSHVDEGRQQPAGLIGAIIVLGPTDRYDPKTDLVAVLSSPADSLEESRAVLINGRLDPVPLTLKVGVPHRLRLINITTARPGLRLELRRDTTVVAWRQLARDGAELPDVRKVMRPGRQPLTIGQTMDFEVTPREPGDLRLVVVANQGYSLGTLTLKVVQ